jgi:parallel beta-helix repeat protein
MKRSYILFLIGILFVLFIQTTLVLAQDPLYFTNFTGHIGNNGSAVNFTPQYGVWGMIGEEYKGSSTVAISTLDDFLCKDYCDFETKINKLNKSHYSGVTFRYKEPGNKYVFFITAFDTLEMTKFVNGQSISMNSTTFIYNSSEELILKTIANGSEFKGYVNGDLLLTASDNNHSNGSMGVYFYGGGNKVAHFDNFKVWDAFSPFNIMQCGDTITENTILDKDIINCTSDGLIIGANDIILDCNNYSITSNNYSSHNIGVYLDTKNNFTLRNCKIEGFFHGVKLYKSNNTILLNNTLTKNYYYAIENDINIFNVTVKGNKVFNNGFGISALMTYNLEIDSNVFYNNTWANVQFDNVYDSKISNNIIAKSPQEGVYMQDAENNEIYRNKIIGNSYGIRTIDSKMNNIHENKITHNSNHTIMFYNSQNNFIWNNSLKNNYNNAYEGDNITHNFWNLSEIGNYWDDFSSNPGYPEHYEILGPGDGIDWHPLNKPKIKINFTKSGPTQQYPYKCYTYDDFSKGSLNPNKWQELPSGSGMIDEHYVDQFREKYHTAQLNPADRGVKIEILNEIFYPEDYVEFDLYYHNGTGNRISFVDIDYSTDWFGLVGWWNDYQQGGNDYGKYHFKIIFTTYGADVFITPPNGTTIQVQQFPQSPGNSHTFGFGTRTGNNGVTHRDYDNVVICRKGN